MTRVADDDRFFEFCARNSDYRIERTADGQVLVVPGTGGRTGCRNLDLSGQLGIWNKRTRRGCGFDSSTLFRLPNGAMRSPDAAWVGRERLARIPEEQREKWVPLCPEFVVELTSPTDRLPEVKRKMEEWMANGCELGWLLDVKRFRVHVYRTSGVQILDNPATVHGEGPVAGFELDLAEIWHPAW